MKAVYRITGTPTIHQISIYLAAAFILYALTSFGAILFHIQDEYWQSGNTVRTLLTSSYLFKFYEVFRNAEQEFPNILKFISLFGVIGQSIFQLLMIPLVFSRTGKKFVICWGFVFFFLSLFLQLSYLPLVELILWSAIFLRPPIGKQFNNSTECNNSKPFFLLFCIAFGSLSLFYILSFPLFSQLPGLRNLNQFTSQFSYSFYNLGFCVPDVFNKADLSMGDYWYCIKRENNSLVPLNGLDGNRLWYHYSDIIYFANSLPWRRYMASDENYYQTPESQTLIMKLIRFDRNFTGYSGDYTVEIYKSYSTKFDITVPKRWERMILSKYILNQ